MLVYPPGRDIPASPCAWCPPACSSVTASAAPVWHRLTTGRETPLARPGHLRRGHTYTQLAAGFDIEVTTACRCIGEAVDALAPLVPICQGAVRTARAKAYVILATAPCCRFSRAAACSGVLARAASRTMRSANERKGDGN
ncbi:transposase family protein [Streptomyces sp. NPDC059340]|uniref:transposase family protein n=1 Tax=Streptomyces sp. NPDC059340 TaxID=3346806 RepID=UPI00367ADC58